MKHPVSMGSRCRQSQNTPVSIAARTQRIGRDAAAHCCVLLCTHKLNDGCRTDTTAGSRDACTRKYTRTASFVFCVHITLLVSRYGLLSDPQSPTFRAVPLSRVGCGCTYSTLSATAATATTTGERLACPQLQTDPEIQR